MYAQPVGNVVYTGAHTTTTGPFPRHHPLHALSKILSCWAPIKITMRAPTPYTQCLPTPLWSCKTTIAPFLHHHPLRPLTRPLLLPGPFKVTPGPTPPPAPLRVTMAPLPPLLCTQAPSGEKYYFPWANWIGQQCPLVEIPAQLSDPTQGRKVYKVGPAERGCMVETVAWNVAYSAQVVGIGQGPHVGIINTTGYAEESFQTGYFKRWLHACASSRAPHDCLVCTLWWHTSGHHLHQ
jgi:hypothetical protein